MANTFETTDHNEISRLLRAGGMPSVNKVGAVTLHFRSEDRFVSARVDGYASLEAAAALLELEPELAVRGDEVWIVTTGGPVRTLCESLDDEIGRWSAGADRFSQEAYFDAHVSVATFLDGYQHTKDLLLTRFTLQEWKVDQGGAYAGMIRTLQSQPLDGKP